MQVHDVQGSKAAKLKWGNEFSYETWLQFMYEGTFNYPNKYMWQTFHGYEQEIGDIRVLPAQNNFSSILLRTDDPV